MDQQKKVYRTVTIDADRQGELIIAMELWSDIMYEAAKAQLDDNKFESTVNTDDMSFYIGELRWCTMMIQAILEETVTLENLERMEVVAKDIAEHEANR